MKVRPQARRSQATAHQLGHRKAHRRHQCFGCGLVFHDGDPSRPYHAPRGCLQPLEGAIGGAAMGEGLVRVRGRDNRRGSGLAMTFPQNLDSALRPTGRVTLSDNQRFWNKCGHRFQMRKFIVALCRRKQANRLRHGDRGDQRRHPPHMHFGHNACAQVMAVGALHAAHSGMCRTRQRGRTKARRGTLEGEGVLRRSNISAAIITVPTMPASIPRT